MVNIGRLKKTVKNGSEFIKEQTQIHSEISRLNNQIKEQENKITQQYTLMGMEYYNKYKNESVSEFEELMVIIKKGQEEIENLKQQIVDLQGIGICSKCGNKLEEDALFCSKCGTPKAQVKNNTKQEEICCNQCGKWMSKQKKFCTNCGNPLQ